jgi:glycosyltransferase involved in cell wall biosynthesis
VNGIATPPGDVDAMAKAMAALATDRLRVRRLATGARATAEALTWDAELDRLDVSYREVCDRAGRVAAASPLASSITTVRSAS